MLYSFDELTFQVLTINKYYHRDGSFNIAPRTFAALSFKLSGNCKFEIRDKKMSLKAGDVLFVPADTPYKAEYSVGCESIVIHLTKCNYNEPEHFRGDSVDTVRRCFENMLSEWSDSRSVNRLKSGIYDVLDQIRSGSGNETVDISFDSCVRYIERNISDPELCLERVCKYGYVSPSGLYRGFVRRYGISPGQYMLRLRLANALDLLVQGELSVKETANACGFSDEKYFSRLFKSKYGYPPSDIHKKMRV